MTTDNSVERGVVDMAREVVEDIEVPGLATMNMPIRERVVRIANVILREIGGKKSPGDFGKTLSNSQLIALVIAMNDVIGDITMLQAQLDMEHEALKRKIKHESNGAALAPATQGDPELAKANAVAVGLRGEVQALKKAFNEVNDRFQEAVSRLARKEDEVKRADMALVLACQERDLAAEKYQAAKSSIDDESLKYRQKAQRFANFLRDPNGQIWKVQHPNDFGLCMDQMRGVLASGLLDGALTRYFGERNHDHGRQPTEMPLHVLIEVMTREIQFHVNMKPRDDHDSGIKIFTLPEDKGMGYAPVSCAFTFEKGEVTKVHASYLDNKHASALDMATEIVNRLVLKRTMSAIEAMYLVNETNSVPVGRVFSHMINVLETEGATDPSPTPKWKGYAYETTAPEEPPEGGCGCSD